MTIQFHDTQEIKDEMKKIPHTGAMLFKDGNIYLYTLLFLGLLNRTYELTDSAIWALDNNRPQTAVNMLRALYETLGFTYYVNNQITSAKDGKEKGERIAALLMGSRNQTAGYKSVNILTCIDKATKMFPLLRKNYDELSEMVHPNSASLFYTGKTDGKPEDYQVIMKVPFYEFKEKDKERVINQIGECCYRIRWLCEETIKNL